LYRENITAISQATAFGAGTRGERVALFTPSWRPSAVDLRPFIRDRVVRAQQIDPAGIG
jgi:hypothetical protein